MAITELTQWVALRRAVPEADQGEMTFELQLYNVAKVVGPISEQHIETVIAAFNG